MKNDDQEIEVETAEAEVSPEQLREEEFHLRYIEQQKRLSCPGCGEGFEIF